MEKLNHFKRQRFDKKNLHEMIICIFGGIFAFILASIFQEGSISGIFPNLQYPYIYSGDGLSYSWLIKRSMEGSIFDNIRNGYPFGASFLDYPSSDFGNQLILKTLGLISGKYFIALNLYYLLSFFTTFVFSFLVMRKIFALNLIFSFVASMLFVFSPFHFYRLPHLYYTWYFGIPIFFLLSYYIFSIPKKTSIKSNKNKFMFFLLILFLASFGVYYALFGVIVVMIGGVMGSLKNNNRYNLQAAIIVSFIISVGVLLNISPNLYNNYKHGRNTEVANRHALESELYGLKMTQLLFPHMKHKVDKLRHFTGKYNLKFPLSNENAISSLGFIGALGFILSFFILLMSLSGRKIDDRLIFLSGINLFLFLFGTIGGLGSIFAIFISPLIRAWNRISIFISFSSILIFFLTLQLVFKNYSIGKNKKFFILAISSILFVIGLYDQSVIGNRQINLVTKKRYELDKSFITQIEKILPKESAVYQLPYMMFPEVPAQYNLGPYDLLSGFLHSKTIRWSFGGMKGREGDLFYRALSNEPLKFQYKIIKDLGFNGIYLDLRGYSDGGKNVMKELKKILGKPDLVRSDKKVVFFRVHPEKKIVLTNLTNRQIMSLANYNENNVNKFSIDKS